MSAIANSNQPEDKPKTSRVKAYWQNIPWKKLSSLLVAIALCFYLTACGGDSKPVSKKDTGKKVDIATTKVIEVSPPTEIQKLSRLLDSYEPQVSIVSPKPEEVLNDSQVAVKFDVKNLPIFKNADFGLGPHIHVTLDNQEYKALYDLKQSITFDRLSPGTHTIRAFASRPWHESFKNQGAYAQVSFNVLTKTGENTPEAKTPLLTYSRPVGTYGAEPILLDFYLQNAPLHSLAKEETSVDDWQVRATVNGQSFTFDRWEPIYLKGFKQGKNWVKLELLEDDGDAIPNVFNSTAHVIDFQPNGTDTLARLVRGEKIANIEAIVNPNYVPPAPVVVPAPVESVSPAPAVTPEAKATETPKAVITSPVTESKEQAKPKEETKSVSKTDKAAPTSVVPVPPVSVKATPDAISPVKVVPPVITKVAPMSEPVKAAPIKVKASPLVEPVKPVAPVKLKATPLSEPVKPIAPKAPDQVTPKAEPVKEAVSEKVPTAPKDYLKSFGFSSRKAIPAQPEVTKPVEKIEVKAKELDVNKSTSEAKSESKPTENPPALTDLTTTTSTPIKVLTKSGK
ncbi:MAG: hypothetical protein DCF19_19140 [Pseudanabaena frigida]|uniref:FHA domain containing protein n=1 Tax=Pseudanabaena frigida TaxID=945775 RepID=A0A2W4VY82_9CYAN|nr:MAG: hypothetical protein DCF19_19140 [Pseudanabaena frigida]